MTKSLRIAILIPTTGGCGQIIRLTAHDRLGASIVIPHDDYRPAQGMNEAYEHLTRPGGVLDGFIGPDSAVRFKLIIKDPPETGNSWAMPVALAHWAQHAGHQIVTESPDLVLWATGSLDAQGMILDRQYHVAQKLHHSTELLQAYASEGAEIAFLLPHGQGQEGVTSLGPLRSYSTHPVANLEQAVHLLGATANPAARMAGKPRMRRAAVAGAFVLVAAGLAATAGMMLPLERLKPKTDIHEVVEDMASLPDPEIAPAPALPPEGDATPPSGATTPEDILFAISILPRPELGLIEGMEKERDLRGGLLSLGFSVSDIRDLTCHAIPIRDYELELRIDPPCTLHVRAVGEPDLYNLRIRNVDIDLCFEAIDACITKSVAFVLP